MDREVGSGCLKVWKNYIVLFCNDIAKIMSKIGGISRRQMFKKPAALYVGWKSIHFHKLGQRSLSRLILSFFPLDYHHNSIRYNVGRMQAVIGLSCYEK